jgi:hypothetical protein
VSPADAADDHDRLPEFMGPMAAPFYHDLG